MSEHLAQRTANLNSMAPPAQRKSKRLEKKNAGPLRRSERGKVSSLSASSGSKSTVKSTDLLKTKRKRNEAKKERSVKQLKMETVEVNKFELEDEQADETQKKKKKKKRMDARAYKALWRNQPKKVNGTERGSVEFEELNPRGEEEMQRKRKSAQTVSNQDHCDDLNGTYSRRSEDLFEQFTERTNERTAVTSTSQSAGEALKKNNEHKLFPTSQKDRCKNTSKNGLVAGEMNDDSEKPSQKNLQSPQLVESIVPGRVLDSDISVQMVQKTMPSKRVGHDVDVDSVASPKMSRNDIGTFAGAGTSLSSGCKRKDCTETCGMCSKRQRVDCNPTEQGICSSNVKLNQSFGTSSYDFTPLSKSVASGSDKIHTTSLHLPNNISKIPALKMVEWENRRKQRDSQKNLHVLLRPQIAKLCEVLHLTEAVKAMVERFLEYVMNNHLVNREPATILQAFQISLCWSAASLLKQKLDHKESLALAKQHLDFTCKKEEADYVYSMLRCLKRMFLYRTGYLKVPNYAKDSGLTPDIQLAQRDLQKSIKEIQKKCDKLVGKLIEKHKEEREKLNQKFEEEKVQLENMKRTEAAVIGFHSSVSMKTDKLKDLDTKYARKLDELKQQMDLERKNLEALQVEARSNILERKARWVESVESWVQVELVKPPVSHQISDASKVNMSDHKTVSLSDALENLVTMEAPSCGKIPNTASSSMPNREVPLKAAECVGFQEGQESLALLLAPSSEKISDINTSRKVDGQVPLTETVVANSDEGQDSIVSAEALSSEENPAGAALSNFDGEVHLRAPETVGFGEGGENLPSLTAPSSERVPGGTTLNMADGELPLGRPEAISSTEGQGNIRSSNCSFEKQIPGRATLNVSDEEISKSTSGIATSCQDIIVCTNPPTPKEPETAPGKVLEGNRVQRENHGTSPMENDQQDGVLRTMNRDSEVQELPPADLSSVQPVPTLDRGGPPPPVLRLQFQYPAMASSQPNDSILFGLVSPNVDSLPYAPSEVQARYTANNEMRNASQVAETSPFNGVIDVTCNVSNPDATVGEQMQQLRFSESTFNLSPPDVPSVSAIEHQSNNEGQTVNQTSQAPGRPVANPIELSNQDVLQPLHPPIDGAVDGLVRQASETRTASVPSVSNGLPFLTAPTVSYWMPLTLYHDPLQNEMERILKEKEQTAKIHEDAKVHLKLECEKEIEEIIVQVRKKYQVKLKEKEAEFLLRKKEFDVNYNKVLLNKILAEAFRSKCMDNKASGPAGVTQEGNSSFMQQLVQLSSQLMVHQPSAASTVSASSTQTVSPALVNAQTMSPCLQPSAASTGSATSMQTVSPSLVNAQTMGPPLQFVNPSALFSGTPTRPPHIGTMSSSTGNLQIGTEVRAPAPHLQPFRPSSISPSSLPHNNHPGASLSLRQSYVNPHAHRRPSGANANPPVYSLSDVSSRLTKSNHQESHVPSSRSKSTQPSGGATDIVCLSDDD